MVQATQSCSSLKAAGDFKGTTGAQMASVKQHAGALVAQQSGKVEHMLQCFEAVADDLAGRKTGAAGLQSGLKDFITETRAEIQTLGRQIAEALAKLDKLPEGMEELKASVLVSRSSCKISVATYNC